MADSVLEKGREVSWSDIDQRTLEEGELEGETIAVIGGASGIGAETARLLDQHGADVFVGDIDPDEGKNRDNGISSERYGNCDITQGWCIDSFLTGINEEHGSIDHIINTAGAAEAAPIGEQSPGQIRDIIETNCYGPALLTQKAANYLSKDSNLVHMASIWGLEDVNIPGDAAYSGSKAGTIKITESASTEVDYNLNCISPALVDTPMNDDLPEKVRQDFIQNYDGRDDLIQPEEVAEVAAHIVKYNQNGDRMTGKNIVVDSGYLSNQATNI